MESLFKKRYKKKKVYPGEGGEGGVSVHLFFVLFFCQMGCTQWSIFHISSFSLFSFYGFHILRSLVSIEADLSFNFIFLCKLGSNNRFTFFFATVQGCCPVNALQIKTQ